MALEPGSLISEIHPLDPLALPFVPDPLAVTLSVLTPGHHFKQHSGATEVFTFWGPFLTARGRKGVTLAA